VNDGDGITACVVCRNEADRLADCLASLTWATETIVLDLASTDESVAVGRAPA
jgi:glycosyltransferase involved in cell wall biosynthesis